MRTMTPGMRVREALRGEGVDRVPFTIYDNMLPRGDVERHLRNDGLAVIARKPACHIEMPNVKVFTRQVREGGLLNRYTLMRTPVGELTSKDTWDPGYGQRWCEVERPIKSSEDYRVMEFVVRDEVYVPAFEELTLAQAWLGQDGYVTAKSRKPPMYRLMYNLLGMEQFTYHMCDFPDEFFSLHDLMWERDQEMLKVAVKAPVEVMRCGGNFHADLVPPALFEKYYLAYIDSFIELAHEQGKLVYTHFDAKIGYMREMIAKSGLDIVEAFTPAPTCDMTVSEAREAWPAKVLWINFPSSVHMEPPETIREETLKILAEAAPGQGFMMGITENIPEDIWRTSLSVISEVLSEHGTLPIRL